MTNIQTTNQQSKAVAQPIAGVDTPLKTDIIVPYVVMMQATSEFVKQRKAQMGDIVRSTSGEKLADPDKGLKVIFLHNPKAEWVLEQKQGDRFKYRRAIPRNASNETLPWSFFADDDGNEMQPGEKGASEWRRVKRLAVFAVLPQDIEAEAAEMKKAAEGELPDPSKALTPVILSFRSTSYKAGQRIATFFTKAKSLGAQVWRYQLSMSASLEKNDDGSFYVWQVDDAHPTPVPKEHVAKVESWANIVNTVGLQVHEDGENPGTSSEREVRDTKEIC